jgi:hypothetical protein
MASTSPACRSERCCRDDSFRLASTGLRRGGSTDPTYRCAGKHFSRLVGLKDAAQYGFEVISGPTLLAAQRQARHMVEFAERVLGR